MNALSHSQSTYPTDPVNLQARKTPSHNQDAAHRSVENALSTSAANIARQISDRACLLGPQSMPIVRMRTTTRRSTTSAVQAANVPALLRRAFAPSPCTLSRCIASWRGPKAQNRVHGVNVVFRHHPPPPCVTSPTMACPPSCTVTRSTRTTCCALARCFLSASIWARYVRLRRVIDRS